jgi:hypothetical protein
MFRQVIEAQSKGRQFVFIITRGHGSSFQVDVVIDQVAAETVPDLASENDALDFCSTFGHERYLQAPFVGS